MPLSHNSLRLDHQGRLFISSPLFQEGLLAVNGCCEALRTRWHPFDLSSDQPSLLDAFISRQETILGAALDDVEAFTEDVIAIAESVCQAVLESVGQEESAGGVDTLPLRTTLKDYLTSSMTDAVMRAQGEAEKRARVQRSGSYASVRGGADEAAAAAAAAIMQATGGLSAGALDAARGMTAGSVHGFTSPLRSGMPGEATERMAYLEDTTKPTASKALTAHDLRDTRSVYEKVMVNRTLRRYPRQTLSQKIEETMAFHMRPDDWWKNSKDRKEKVALLGRFIRLVDVMVQETLRAVVEARLREFSEYLDRYQPTSALEDPRPAALTPAPEPAKAKAALKRGVVFAEDEGPAAEASTSMRAVVGSLTVSTSNRDTEPRDPSAPVNGDAVPSTSFGAPPGMRDPAAKPFIVIDLQLLSNFVGDADRLGSPHARRPHARRTSLVNRTSNVSQDGGPPPPEEPIWAHLEYVPANVGLMTRVIVFFERLQETMTRARRVASQRAFSMFFAQQARDAVHQRNMSTKREGEEPARAPGAAAGGPMASAHNSDDEGDGHETVVSRRAPHRALVDLQAEADHRHAFEQSNYADLIPESAIGELMRGLERRLVGALAGLDSIKAHFVVQVELFKQNCGVSMAGLRDRYHAQELTLEGFEHLLDAFYGQVRDFTALPQYIDFRMVRVSLTALKGALVPSPERCVSIIHQLLPALAYERYNQVVSVVHEYNRRLRSELGSVEDFIQLTENLAHVTGAFEELLAEADRARDMYRLLTVNEIQVPAMQYAAYQTMSNDFQMLKETIDFADQRKDKLTSTFEQEIHREGEGIMHLVQELQATAQNELIFHIGYVSPDPLKAAEELEKKRRDEAFQKRMAAMHAAVQAVKTYVKRDLQPPCFFRCQFYISYGVLNLATLSFCMALGLASCARSLSLKLNSLCRTFNVTQEQSVEEGPRQKGQEEGQGRPRRRRQVRSRHL